MNAPTIARAGFVGTDEKGRFVHYCHCGAWGSFGVEVSLREGKLGTWYCAEHRPKPVPVAVPETPAPKAAPKTPPDAPWPGPTSPSRCAHCGKPEARGNVLLPIGVRDHVWLHDLCREAWRASRYVACLAELKAKMAAAHPDRGGSSAAFIAARREYVAARRAMRP
jgi:hypothetical protein